MTNDLHDLHDHFQKNVLEYFRSKVKRKTLFFCTLLTYSYLCSIELKTIKKNVNRQ